MFKQLNLFVPEWQGYGVDASPARGARHLRDAVFSGSEFCEIDTDSKLPLKREMEIVGRTAIIDSTTSIKHAIIDSQPDRIFTLGGTCGTEVIPVTWLNHRYQNDLAVIWFDAHADLNTPASSPSGHFHGMPLRTILGEGDRDLCGMACSAVQSTQVFLVGARDLDPPESEFIEAVGIRQYPATLSMENLVRDIREAGFSNIYIHFDFDVLEPKQFQDMIFHVPDGMVLSRALDTIEALSNEFHVVGSSLLEFVNRGKTNTEFLNNLAHQLH